MVEGLRASKDPDEVEAIRRAAALAHDALSPDARHDPAGPDRTGDRLAARSRRFANAGSEWHPFETIVASGPRSALPHARAADRVVERGDLLLLDFGATVDGILLGPHPDRRGGPGPRCAAARVLRRGPGRPAGRDFRDPGRDVRAARPTRWPATASRRPASARPFATPSGHGLGLEVHEEPRLAPTAEGVLPAGAVVTIEPGVYFEGWGGVRLEDDVFLSTEGPTLVSPGAPAFEEVP